MDNPVNSSGYNKNQNSYNEKYSEFITKFVVVIFRIRMLI